MAIQTGGLHHLGFRITDLPRSRHFYVDVLGFTPIVDTDEVVLMDAHGTMLGITGGADTSDRFDPFRVGLDHLALAVSNPDALPDLKQQLDAAGVPNNGIENDPMTGATYISFYDPDGIAWELYSMPTP